MARGTLAIATFLLLAALPTAGQSMLPASFSGWNAVANGGGLGNLHYLPPNAAEELLEYGTVEAERRIYASGAGQLSVTLYRMKDTSGAYGAYSFLRTSDMARARLSDHSSISPQRALVLTGNLVLDISGKHLPSLQEDLKALVAGVGPHAERGPYPTLWRHLPTEGIVPRSDRYLLGPSALKRLLPLAAGDWLGFSSGVEAELARYRLHGQEVTLIVADFPTPQAAEQKMEELRTILNLNVTAANDARPVVFARRTMTLVALVVGARTKPEADLLLSQIHSGTELTWNEPSFSLTDPSVSQMLVGTIIGTGILCLFTLVAGLAFGGVRLVVKRLVPGRIFDRSDTMQILQLGLSSKPIDSKDFYGSWNTRTASSPGECSGGR